MNGGIVLIAVGALEVLGMLAALGCIALLTKRRPRRMIVLLTTAALVMALLVYCSQFAPVLREWVYEPVTCLPYAL